MVPPTGGDVASVTGRRPEPPVTLQSLSLSLSLSLFLSLLAARPSEGLSNARAVASPLACAHVPGSRCGSRLSCLHADDPWEYITQEHESSLSYPAIYPCRLAYHGWVNLLCPDGGDANVTVDKAWHSQLLEHYPLRLRNDFSVPIFANQWGVKRSVPLANGRLEYARDVAGLFVERGVHSALWIWRSYRKDSWGFELVHEDSRREESEDMQMMGVLNAAWRCPQASTSADTYGGGGCGGGGGGGGGGGTGAGAGAGAGAGGVAGGLAAALTGAPAPSPHPLKSRATPPDLAQTGGASIWLPLPPPPSPLWPQASTPVPPTVPVPAGRGASANAGVGTLWRGELSAASSSLADKPMAMDKRVPPCPVDWGARRDGVRLRSVGEMTLSACCALCRALTACAAFNFDEQQRRCYLLSQPGQVRQMRTQRAVYSSAARTTGCSCATIGSFVRDVRV